MPSSFPTSSDSFTTKVDSVTTIAAKDVNDLQNSAVALENSLLGTTPATLSFAMKDWGGMRFNVQSAANPSGAAKGNAQIITDGAMNGTTGVLTSASNKFVAGDVGKLCVVPGAGAAGVPLSTTIASYQSAGQVTLGAVSQTAVASSIVTWCSDDYASINAAYTAASAVPGAIIEIPPVAVGYGHSQKFTWPLSIGIEGNVRELGGSLIGGNNSRNECVIPTIAPFLTGSVLIPMYLNDDGILFTSQGGTPNLHGLGVRFGGLYNSTGHGIQCLPPADGGNRDLGIWGVDWQNVKVYGHDGNHYGFRVINPFYNKISNLRSYGGGGLQVRSDTIRTVYGNTLFDQFYSVVFLAGSAHGVRLESVSSQGLGQLTFVAPQAWIWTQNPAIPGTSNPTSAQLPLSADANAGPDIDIFHPDWETDYPATPPIWDGNGQGGLRMYGGIGNQVNNRPTNLGIVSSGPQIRELVLVGATSQAQNHMEVWDSFGGLAGQILFRIVPGQFGGGTCFLKNVSAQTLSGASPSLVLDGSILGGGPVYKITQGTTAQTLSISSTNVATGQWLELEFIHFADSSTWTLSWGASFKRAGGSFPNTNTSGAKDTIAFLYDGAAWVEQKRAINLS